MIVSALLFVFVFFFFVFKQKTAYEVRRSLVGSEMCIRDRRKGLWFYNGERTWRYGYPPMLYPTHSTGFLVGVTGERLTKVSCLGFGAEGFPGLSDNAYKNPYSCQTALFRTSGGHICRCNVMWAIWGHGERA